MAVSIFKEKQNKLLRKKAQKLYREGLSLREVGKVLKKSHQWVSDALKSFPLDKD